MLCIGRKNTNLNRVTQRRVGTCVSVPNSLLSVSYSDLVVVQRADPTLSELFCRVLSVVDSRSAMKGYLLHDQVLVRECLPFVEYFVGCRSSKVS